MRVISFYKLHSSETLPRTVAAVCAKIIDQAEKCLIICENDERCAELDSKLWTFGSNDFLPHAMVGDAKFKEFADAVPVILSDKFIDGFQNVILLCKPVVMNEVPDSVKLFYVFDGTNGEYADLARSTFKHFKGDATITLKIYTQQSDLSWQQQ